MPQMRVSLGLAEGRGGRSRDRRLARERGVSLVLVTVIVLFVSLAALGMLALADAAFQRVRGDDKIERATLVAETGLSYYVEQWRRTSSALDSTTYPATTTAQNANVGVGRLACGGTFTALSIDRVTLGAGGATEGRILTLRGEYDGYRCTFRALLSPNLNSPIQGVGTSSTQTWNATARFRSNGADQGTVFGNAGATFASGSVVTGNAKFAGTITNNGSISGTIAGGQAPVTFPDQAAIVNAAISSAQANQNVASFWRNTRTDILNAGVATGGTKPTAMERIPITAPNALGSGWTSGANTMNLAHYMIRDGNLTLPAGNYAFGRLYLDGTVLTLKAPAGGGTLVMPDIYLTNGARLILDTTDGPFSIVTGTNNVYGGTQGTTGAERYASSTNTFASGAPTLTMPGGDTGIWNVKGGSTNPVKKAKGNGSYDDWQIKDGSLLATVTTHPSDKGAELFMRTDVDLTLTNGSALLGGIQAGDLASLKDKSVPLSGTSSILSLGRNSPGFQAWSAGGGNPRIDINTDAGAGGNPSLYSGLTYGGWPGRIGSNGTLEGAFVGTTLVNSGTIIYDSRLLALVASGDANSQHVVIRTRLP